MQEFSELLSQVLPASTYEVLSEREKQKRKYSASHDDEHVTGELLLGALSLTIAVSTEDAGVDVAADDGPCNFWGLNEKYANDRRKRLIVAAALLLAELERADRAEELGGIRDLTSEIETLAAKHERR